jgi:hypothetical protein
MTLAVKVPVQIGLRNQERTEIISQNLKERIE